MLICAIRLDSRSLRSVPLFYPFYSGVLLAHLLLLSVWTLAYLGEIIQVLLNRREEQSFRFCYLVQIWKIRKKGTFFLPFDLVDGYLKFACAFHRYFFARHLGCMICSEELFSYQYKLPCLSSLVLVMNMSGYWWVVALLSFSPLIYFISFESC